MRRLTQRACGLDQRPCETQIDPSEKHVTRDPLGQQGLDVERSSWIPIGLSFTIDPQRNGVRSSCAPALANYSDMPCGETLDQKDSKPVISDDPTKLTGPGQRRVHHCRIRCSATKQQAGWAVVFHITAIREFSVWQRKSL